MLWKACANNVKNNSLSFFMILKSPNYEKNQICINIMTLALFQCIMIFYGYNIEESKEVK